LENGVMQAARVGQAVRVGDLKKRRFTLPQAAQILKIEADLLRKTVDRGWLAKSYVQFHGRKLRALDGIDIVCLLINGTVSPNVRNTLYLQLKHWPEDQYLAGTMELQVEAPSGRRTIDVSLDRPVHDAMAGINALERTVEAVDADGIIYGTGVEAHRIAALVDRGMTAGDVLRDYPNLTAAQVESALAFAKVNPKHGRPYPTRTVKAALRKGRGGIGRAFAAGRGDDAA
jgi:uncharacterized protein (DUF433 family)